MMPKKQEWRLNSYLSRAGIAARRKCDQLIQDGAVIVNNQVIRDPGYRIRLGKDNVVCQGNTVTPKKVFSYVLLNKPKGVVCTVRDEHKRRTVVDLVSAGMRLFPVGRLDITTTGLILLTDDGELGFRLMHPKFTVDKVYSVSLHKPLLSKDSRQLEHGVSIGTGETVSARVGLITGNGVKLQVIVHEGKKNMVKRMFDALGYRVVSLDRVKFAGLTKHRLPRGGWRFLSDFEIKKLYTLVSLGSRK